MMTSARSPTEKVRKLRSSLVGVSSATPSPGLTWRMGSHSKYACKATDLRSSQSPSVSGWWFSAPVLNESFVVSWSSHTLMKAYWRCSSCKSRSRLYSP